MRTDVPHDATGLRYLSPDHVEGALPKGHVDVRDRKDRRIGNFDGVLYDPEAGRVRYLVVDSPRLFSHKRYLLPVDPTQVDVERHALLVDVDGNDVGHFMNFDARRFPDFSDDDLMTALFPKGSSIADEDTEE